jgi:hypothetical protein
MINSLYVYSSVWSKVVNPVISLLEEMPLIKLEIKPCNFHAAVVSTNNDGRAALARFVWWLDRGWRMEVSEFKSWQSKKCPLFL